MEEPHDHPRRPASRRANDAGQQTARDARLRPLSAAAARTRPAARLCRSSPADRCATGSANRSSASTPWVRSRAATFLTLEFRAQRRRPWSAGRRHAPRGRRRRPDGPRQSRRPSTTTSERAKLWDGPAVAATHRTQTRTQALIERALRSGRPESRQGGNAMSALRRSAGHRQPHAPGELRRRLRRRQALPPHRRHRRSRTSTAAAASSTNGWPRCSSVPYIADLAKALARKDVDVVSICAAGTSRPDRRPVRRRPASTCTSTSRWCRSSQEADAPGGRRAEGRRQEPHVQLHQPAVGARRPRSWSQRQALGRLLAIHADAFFAKGRTGTAKLGSRRKEEYPPQRHQLIEAKRELDNVGVYPITLIRWLTGSSSAPSWASPPTTSSRSIRSTTSRTSACCRARWTTACR